MLLALAVMIGLYIVLRCLEIAITTPPETDSRVFLRVAALLVGLVTVLILWDVVRSAAEADQEMGPALERLRELTR